MRYFSDGYVRSEKEKTRDTPRQLNEIFNGGIKIENTHILVQQSWRQTHPRSTHAHILTRTIVCNLLNPRRFYWSGVAPGFVVFTSQTHLTKVSSLLAHKVKHAGKLMKAYINNCHLLLKQQLLARMMLFNKIKQQHQRQQQRKNALKKKKELRSRPYACAPD